MQNQASVPCEIGQGRGNPRPRSIIYANAELTFGDGGGRDTKRDWSSIITVPFFISKILLSCLRVRRAHFFPITDRHVSVFLGTYIQTSVTWPVLRSNQFEQGLKCPLGSRRCRGSIRLQVPTTELNTWSPRVRHTEWGKSFAFIFLSVRPITALKGTDNLSEHTSRVIDSVGRTGNEWFAEGLKLIYGRLVRNLCGKFGISHQRLAFPVPSRPGPASLIKNARVSR